MCMVVVMMMTACASLWLRHAHVDVERGHDAAPHAAHDELVVESETGEVGLELLARETRVEQRTEQHVAGDPGEQVQVEDPRSRVRSG